MQSPQAATALKHQIESLFKDQAHAKKPTAIFNPPQHNPFKTLPKDVPAREKGGRNDRGSSGNFGNQNNNNFNNNRFNNNRGNFNNRGGMGFQNNRNFSGPPGGNMGGNMNFGGNAPINNFGGNNMGGGMNNFGGGFNRGGMMGNNMRGGMGGRGGRGGGMGMNNMGGGMGGMSMPMGNSMMGMGGGMSMMGGNMGMMGGMGTLSPSLATLRVHFLLLDLLSNIVQEVALVTSRTSIQAFSTNNKAAATTGVITLTVLRDRDQSRFLGADIGTQTYPARELCNTKNSLKTPARTTRTANRSDDRPTHGGSFSKTMEMLQRCKASRSIFLLFQYSTHGFSSHKYGACISSFFFLGWRSRLGSGHLWNGINNISNLVMSHSVCLKFSSLIFFVSYSFLIKMLLVARHQILSLASFRNH